MKIPFILQKETYIQAACGTNKGKIREKNEDNLYFAGKTGKPAGADRDDSTIRSSASVRLTEEGGKDSLFAVFDGIGGIEHGELASRRAAAGTCEFFDNHRIGEFEDAGAMLDCMCRELNGKVYCMSADGSASGGGTTFAALYFAGKTVWSCNVGDSRCYRFSRGMLEMMSVDHNEDMFRADNISRKRKPKLIQYLGMDPQDGELEPYISNTKVNRGDIFLVCSDGLTDMVAEPDIADVLRKTESAEDAAGELIDMALRNGGRDNVSVIVCR